MGLLAGAFPGSWVAYLVVGGAIALSSAGATYAVKNAFDQNTIKDLKLEKANKALADANTALVTFTGDISRINLAAGAFQLAQTDIEAGFEQLSRDFRHATASRPLPPGCLPDSPRVFSFHAAIDRANGKGPAGPGTVGGVPGTTLPGP